jgi:hypothetical protein
MVSFQRLQCPSQIFASLSTPRIQRLLQFGQAFHPPSVEVDYDSPAHCRQLSHDIDPVDLFVKRVPAIHGSLPLWLIEI